MTLEKIDGTDYENLINQRSLGAELTIIPTRRGDDKRVYRIETASLPKLLQHGGVSADFLDDPSSISWLDLRGTTEISLAAVIGLNVLSAASWDAIKMGMALWLDALPFSARLELDVGVEDADGSRKWFRARGRAEDVLAALDRLRDESSEP